MIVHTDVSMRIYLDVPKSCLMHVAIKSILYQPSVESSKPGLQSQGEYTSAKVVRIMQATFEAMRVSDWVGQILMIDAR